MDPYDSDSSGLEDAGDYTETTVLLGYASTEPTDDTISHLGGWPTWLDENNPPPGDLANCKVCNNPMLLLLQLNGDLPEHFPDDERRLYVFGCPRKVCNRKPGSIRALRGIRKFKSSQSSKQKPSSEETTPNPEIQQQPTPTKPKPDLGSALFGAPPSSSGSSLTANANPFSTSSSPSSQNNPFAPLPPASTLAAKPPQTPVNKLSESFASKVRVSSPPPEPAVSGPVLPWPPQSAFPPPYVEYHLDAEYETLSRPSTPTIPTNTTVENIEEEDASKAGAADTKDTFESSLDKSFLRFSTRLGYNPEQVLRYEFRGTPLLYSSNDAVAAIFPNHQQSQGGHVAASGGGASRNRVPRCTKCGSERVFELQLVPHTITVLEDGREGIGLGKNDAGMEWGTIILGVCAADCGPAEGQAGWREEWIGVQWEEMK
ncbi:programmed cell death protein 2 [Talaromyces proteolyticus]|uniref:Programmed cell death protein 2 n=1 Tax=Talaromyces proteolyticus TaxID=1131652 RepID=A0AAD4KN74_9EURO|nr:programmed cell death protein 2 [Talaromyces proteolyticus]KAH8692995.1 programmed cell death protein 2 [Talaromyces proteolyticus]